jgi:hypothetical protein
MRRLPAIVAGILATLAILVAAGFAVTPYDNFVLLADAFRHGRVWIDWPGPYIDALPYNGRYYVIEAPMPALLLFPAVLVRGTAVSQSLLSALLGGVATFAGWEIARRLGVPSRTTAILCLFLLLGTDVFWCATFGDVWFIAHVAAVAFTLLVLREFLGRRRGWLVALFAVCALESRFTMAVALPVYGAMLWFGTGLDPQRDRDSSASRRSLLQFACVLVPAAALWVWYNELRWHVPYDIGYTAWYHEDQVGLPDGSPFRLMYLPMQLRSFFVQYPDLRATFPFLIPSIAGVALTWTSPGLLIALFARWPLRIVAAMWLAAILCAVPNFLYYVNGFAQFGMRHALDFEPFLFVLIALAARPGLGPLGLALCAYSSVAGAWGTWYWRAFIRH